MKKKPELKSIPLETEVFSSVLATLMTVKDYMIEERLTWNGTNS